MLVTWGFANMETPVGLLSRFETLITRDLLQKMTPSSTEEPENDLERGLTSFRFR